MDLFEFENKRLRSVAIKNYMQLNGYDKAVCFSCGNASRELRNAGVNVLDISPYGDLDARRWFTIAEINKVFPEFFDATSGHLPMDCMLMVAEEFKKSLGDVSGTVNIPTGSGETLVCMKIAYPTLTVNAIYNLGNATKYESQAPLNKLVFAIADNVFGIEPENV